MNVQGNGAQRTDNFNVTIDQFVRQYTGARRGLWTADGRVVELGAAIECDFAARKILIGRVEQLEGVKGSRNFKLQEMDPEQLLLLLAWGPDKKTERSQHLKAIRKFKEIGLERTEAAYVAWVEKEGGFRKAGQSDTNKNACNVEPDVASQADDHAGGESNRPQSAPKKVTDGVGFQFHSNVMTLCKRSFGLPVVDAKLPDDLFVENAAALVLIIKDRDRDGVEHIKLVPVAQDENLVAKAVSQAARDQSASFKEALLLHFLNDYALGHERAPTFDGDISSDRAIKFRAVFEKLQSKPNLCAKYGLESATVTGVNYCNDGHKDNGSVEVVNHDFHRYDPGRFIDGVKPGVLVPYSLEGSLEQVQQAAIGYDQDFRAWKAAWQKPNRTMGSSHASMALAERQSVSEPKEDAGDGDLVTSTVGLNVTKVTGEDEPADDGTRANATRETDDARAAKPADTDDGEKVVASEEEARAVPENGRPRFVLDLSKVELEPA